MNPVTAIVAFAMIWMIVFFVTLPFGVRTPEEEQVALEPGQIASAPVKPRIGLKILLSAAISAVLFGCYYVALEAGWLGFTAELLK